MPDTVVPARIGSDIIDRINASRKARHEAAVEDFHQELSVISAEIGPKMSKISGDILLLLGDNDVKVTNKLSQIEKDEDLLKYTLSDLNKLWAEVQEFSPQRQKWITDLDTELRELEDERMGMIRKVFQDYAKLFEKISYLLHPDLSHFLDRESQAINQTCLSNKRAFADLFVRLMSTDTEREKNQHSHWRRRVEDWKDLNINLAVEKFKEFMNSEDVVNPSKVRSVQDFMLSELKILNEKRLEFIKSLSNLKPPALTKSAVYNWRSEIQAVTKELDSVTQMHMSKVHDEMERVCQMCLDKIESLRQSLLDGGILTESRAMQMIEQQMLPLVGEQQLILENNLETMERAQEAHCQKMEEEMHSLFKFAQGTAHLWDVHEIGLAKKERALQEMLEDCRHNHDYTNQDKEAELDIVMDRLRQDATEGALRDSLTKALEMLDKIRESYGEFHKEQTDIVQSYPKMVDEELQNFDKAVCTFFSVDRLHPEEKARQEVEAAAAVETETTEAEPLRTQSVGQQVRVGSTRSSLATPVKRSAKPKLSVHLPEGIKSLVMAVAEELRTERGTTFYVLKVAGEHGVAEEEGVSGEKAGEEKSSQLSVCGAFITEIPVSVVEEQEKPDYIRCLDLPLSIILEAKKMMRCNLLNFLEIWCIDAQDRSNSVVIAKCEELNSELDLRLHLHQPRSRRAELDVHNVRAAELVMHAQRVTRHCKGISQSLNDLKQRFLDMSTEHNNLAVKFRQEIEALEIVFINATKSSVLVSLQNKLGANMEKFMTVIRTSLRQFRKHLDETLQMLRESNARFIKSFKLFSGGGNFCPEEIEEYRKRLEKMSDKIDSAEGSIMSELEGMESKRLDVATKVSNEFEDRFKSHMFDLLFMEKVARWLTNTQVKIKAEVAASNSQAQIIAQHLKDLQRRIDACEKPNWDKEQITVVQLNDFLKTVMEAFHQRSQYLNCLKTLNRPPSNIAVGGQGQASKVGLSDGITPVSKAGTRPSDDPSINVIKSILKTQKTKFRFGPDADLDGEQSSAVRAVPAATPVDATFGDKSKSGLSQVSAMPAGSRRPTLPSIQSSDTSLRRVPSGNLRRQKLGAKSDRKISLFGEKEMEEENKSAQDGKEDPHFIASIQKTLQAAIKGLATTAEVYYRQKGTRLVTRPQVLQETMEQFMDVVNDKLQSYYLQCDDYHNQCLQEFRQQLTQTEQLAARVPALVINDLVKQHLSHAQDAHKKLLQEFQVTLDKFIKEQREHENSLRPTLGHPHLAPQLEILGQQESVRHQDNLMFIAQQTQSLQACALNHAKTLVDALACLSEQQLQQYDRLLVVDDTEKGRVQATRHPTSELIRRRNAGESLEDEEDTKDALSRGKGNWLGIPSNQLVAENRPTKLQLTPTVQTAKTSLAHSATVKARDSAYEDYKVYFERTLVMIQEEAERLTKDEQHWTTSWQTSVQRVRDLY